MEELLKEMDKEKEERFKKSWTKLDKGTKLNRLSVFIKLQKTENELNDAQEKHLKTLLHQLCDSGALNKSSDVEYSDETYQILSIKNLEFDEMNKKYSFKLPEKKTKNISKSKSNVERHFNRSKGNRTL